MARRREPILGLNERGATFCTRIIEGGRCDMPGRWHVIWSDNLASVSCDGCKPYIIERLVFQQIHDLRPDCLDPAALWFIEERVCRVPRDGEDASFGVYVLGN